MGRSFLFIFYWCLGNFCFTFLGTLPLMGQHAQEAEELLELLSNLKESPDKVDVLNKLGAIYREKNIDSCFNFALHAKHLATELDYEQGLAESDQLIAYSFYKQGLYAEALELFGQLKLRHETHKDTLNLIRTLIDMASVKNKGISDREEIVKLIHEAMTVGEKFSSDSILATVYLSYILRQTDLSDDSIHFYLDRIDEIEERFPNEATRTHALLWRARLLILQGDIDKAAPMVHEAFSYSKKANHIPLQVNSLFLKIALSDTKGALTHLYQAYEISRNSGDISLDQYILNHALSYAKILNDEQEIIHIYELLEEAMSNEWERSRKFVSDYVRFQSLQNEHKLLNQKNFRRAIWIAVISLLAVVMILLIYLLMFQRERKVKRQLEVLNDMAGFQILKMEESKLRAVQKVQKRLGQELHDDLSSNLAAIRNQIELLSMDVQEESLKTRIKTIRNHLDRTYHTTRRKSHDWYQGGVQLPEEAFKKQIKELVDLALPDEKYTKNIQIDENILSNVHTEAKIALIRIVQEAITNIIKHAKAKTVDILIYQDGDELLMSIQDDGRGIDPKRYRIADPKNDGLGLASIHRRIKYLRGTIQINSDERGTEILVSIPILNHPIKS